MNRLSTILICLTSLSGCDAIDAVKATKNMPAEMRDMQSRMEVTNNNIEQTNEKVHLQALKEAKEGMLAEENSRFLSPVPFDMIPYAKKFAEEARPAEIAQLAYIWLKFIAKQEESSNPEAAAKLNHSKAVRFQGLMLIAAFAPAGTIQNMIREQIENSGHYEKDALAVLTLRAWGLKIVRLDQPLLDGSEINNLGNLKEAVERAEDLETIYSHNFAKKIKVSAQSGFLKDYLVEVFGAPVDQKGVATLAPHPDLPRDTWSKISNGASELLLVYTGQKSSATVAPGDTPERASEEIIALTRSLTQRALDKAIEWANK